MRYVWATASHVGRVRGRNEDAVYPETSGSSDSAILVGVADGMGGAIAGNVASSTALEAATDKDAESGVTVVERIVAGNDELLGEIGRNPELRGMGTTLTLGLFSPNGTLELGHVGDSRAYLIRSGELELLTTDHTVVAELVAMGHLDPADAERHPQRHLLTRALGLGPVLVDYETVALADGGPHPVLLRRADLDAVGRTDRRDRHRRGGRTGGLGPHRGRQHRRWCRQHLGGHRRRP